MRPHILRREKGAPWRVASAAIVADGRGASPPTRGAPQEVTIDSVVHKCKVHYEQIKDSYIDRPVCSNIKFFCESDQANYRQLIVLLELVSASAESIYAKFEAFLLHRDGQPPSEMGKHFGSLFDSLDGTDVSFIIGTETVHAHQVVLAAQSSKLWEGASVNTVAGILHCAEMYSCVELKNKCIDFFALEDNFKKAVWTKGFVKLGHEFPSIIDDLRQRIGV
ncbi:hypothetical protein BDA96_03G177000 [Sorghum bicolor]|uniref:BPM/SPOP BACK domain-containing protein n=1 Tax=Sorghum bicolor TaxID=4558 RepID=A0A921UNR0_SORBI|nr:hypothetical protein BDA96_03G177000 [Sorghum bicolor]